MLAAADGHARDVQGSGLVLRVLEKILERLEVRVCVDHEQEIERSQVEIGTKSVTGLNGRLAKSGTLMAVPLVSMVRV